LKLVKASKNDIEEILSLHEKLFNYEYTYENYANEIELGFAGFMVLKNDDKIVGYFIVHSIFEQMEIVIIAIDEEYQQKGYGKFLLEYIEYLSHKNGCNEIILEVSHLNNKAISFYEKNKFNEIAKRKDYYCKDNHALILKKKVS